MKNLEQELKLRLDERSYGLLSQLTEQPSVLQINHYFQPLPQDVMVRIRERQGVYTLCFKRRLSDSEGIAVCEEKECELQRDYAETLLSRGITPQEINSMLGTDFTIPLTPAGEMKTYRTKCQAGQWTLELDKNVYLGKTDYELECESGDASALLQLKNWLSFNYMVQPVPSSPKSQRFFEALNEI